MSARSAGARSSRRGRGARLTRRPRRRAAWPAARPGAPARVVGEEAGRQQRDQDRALGLRGVAAPAAADRAEAVPRFDEARAALAHAVAVRAEQRAHTVAVGVGAGDDALALDGGEHRRAQRARQARHRGGQEIRGRRLRHIEEEGWVVVGVCRPGRSAAADVVDHRRGQLAADAAALDEVRQRDDRLTHRVAIVQRRRAREHERVTRLADARDFVDPGAPEARVQRLHHPPVCLCSLRCHRSPSPFAEYGHRADGTRPRLPAVGVARSTRSGGWANAAALPPSGCVAHPPNPRRCFTA